MFKLAKKHTTTMSVKWLGFACVKLKQILHICLSAIECEYVGEISFRKVLELIFNNISWNKGTIKPVRLYSSTFPFISIIFWKKYDSRYSSATIGFSLSLSWRRLLSYRNQSIDLFVIGDSKHDNKSENMKA